MKRLLLVTDPIGGPTSVQFDLITALVRYLRDRYQIAFFAPYCDSGRVAILRSLGCEVLAPPHPRFGIDRMLRFWGVDNESMLWAESWLREAVFEVNTAEASRLLDHQRFDYVVNLSMTVPVPSDLWWILGTPLDQTIQGMSGTNLIAQIVSILGIGVLSQMDQSVVHRIQSQTRNIVANSPFLRDLHRERGVPVKGVIYSLTEMSGFVPSNGSPKRDFVLLYLGKETEMIDFAALKRAGLRIVAFGSKIPAGSRLASLKQLLDFRGRVSREMLVALYSNALFTLFPFTCEPMGLVPIESMACGTPVLTYDRQGPASTVVDGVTGWLVDSQQHMVEKAIQIWQNGSTGIAPQQCIERAQQFTMARSVDDLVGWIDGGAPRTASAPSAPRPKLLVPEVRGEVAPLVTRNHRT